MPEKPENDTSKEPNKPRRELFTEKLADGEVLEMPPCEAFYIVSYLFEIGPGMSGGMGEAPITHGEIESWQRNTGIELNAWEARTLKRLSIEYLNESHKATKPDCPAPWDESNHTKVLPSLASQRVKNSMRALAAL